MTVIGALWAASACSEQGEPPDQEGPPGSEVTWATTGGSGALAGLAPASASTGSATSTPSSLAGADPAGTGGTISGGAATGASGGGSSGGGGSPAPATTDSSGATGPEPDGEAGSGGTGEVGGAAPAPLGGGGSTGGGQGTAVEDSGSTGGGGSGPTAGSGGDTESPSGGQGTASGGEAGGDWSGTGAGVSGNGGNPGDEVPEVDEETLGALVIEANPRNVLSCFVSWETSQPASSAVQFGTDSLTWEISDPTPVTSHRVLVIGMHANETYRLKAISEGDDGVASAEGTFTTGSLPASIPVAEVTVNETARVQPGWTLMNTQKGDGTATARSRDPNQAVMYDAEGQPVWYYINGTGVDRGGAVSVDLTDQGVLIGAIMNDAGQTAISPKEIDLEGNVLWECPDATCGGTGTLTHHVGKLPNGNYVIQRDVTAGSGTAPVYEELTPDNQVVWTWDYRTFVPAPANAMGDWCHGNSITIDLEQNEVYANCRWMGLVKTTYQNPTIQWHLPASYGAAGLGDMTFSPPASQYSDTHDPEIHDDGTILFFDNGGYSGVVGEEGNPHGYHSRAVEYLIDEQAKTATLVWEFPGDFPVDPWYKNDWYLPFWGDADRLANGNVLITAGVRGTSVQSRIFEVTKEEGEVVWEFRLPPDFGVYRSERIEPPLVHAIER